MAFTLDRRRFLATLGIGSSAFLLRDLVPAVHAEAEAFGPDEMPLLVFCYFSGGWDQLLALDPRDNTAFGAPGGAIQTGYDLVADSVPFVRDVLSATGGTGLVRPAGSPIAFGPAIGRLADRWADLCVVRGMDMGTLTHEVGRRYFLTGKFPRGLAPSGSSLPTWVAAQGGDATPIPNLVVRVESYNEGLDPFATGLAVQGTGDLRDVLSSIGTPLSEGAASAVDRFLGLETDHDCRFDGDGMISTFRSSREKAKRLASGELLAHFDFVANPPPGGEVAEVYAAFGIDPAAPQLALAGPKGQAAIAAQAIARGVSQVVSIELASGLDTHDDEWSTDHAPKLREGFDAIADLISYLESHLDSRGRPYWERTVLVAFSEFSRTPGINARGGRDHHLASSCLVTGMGIQGGIAIGATDDAAFARQTVNLDTGEVDPDGVLIRPPDVHATLLSAAGLPYDHIANQSPRIIGAMKR